MKQFDRVSRRPGVWAGSLLVALGVALLVPWRVVAQGSVSVELERALLTPSVGGVWSIAFSPDGTRLASTAVRVGGPSDNRHPIQEVYLWDLQTGERKLTLSASRETLRSVVQETLRSVAFSPDGMRIAGATGKYDRSGEVLLWDAQTGELKQTLTGHTNWLHAVAFSPDGKILASASVDRTVRLWNAQTGALLRTLADHRYPVYSVAFSPDSMTLASASASSGSKFVSEVKLWDVQAGTEQQTLTVADAWVNSVTFSPAGQILATGSSRKAAGKTIGEVTLWDAHTAQLLRTLTGHSESVQQVAFSPDGKTLVSGGTTDDTAGTIIGGEVALWDSQTGQLLWSVTGDQLPSGAWSIVFSPDGTHLASGDADRTVRIWRVR